MSAIPLSLCTLVRPELAFRGDGLQFLAPRVAQTILIDTQPFSGARRLVDRLGAKHIKHNWRDSFSEARNVGLTAADHDFVLILDGNERIEPKMFDLIETLVGDGIEPGVVHCLRVDVVDSGGEVIESTYEPRLWRTSETIRYEGRVYERLECGADAQFIYHDDIRVVQLDEMDDPAERAAIVQRNIDLLETQINEQPDDMHTEYCIGLQMMLLGDYESARVSFARVCENEAYSDRGKSALVFSVECLRQLGSAAEAFDLGLEATRHAQDYGELWFFIGRAALEADMRIKADAAFRNARRIPSGASPDLFRDPTIAEWRGDLGRAQALASLRDAKAAERILHETRDRMPIGIAAEVDVDFIRIWLQLDQPSLAWATLEPWLNTMPDWCSVSFVEILEYFWHAKGPHSTYRFFQECLVAHNAFIKQLPVASVGAALAEINQDEESQYELLRLCMDLGSQDPMHYATLSRILVQRGELEYAKEIADKGRALPDEDRPS